MKKELWSLIFLLDSYRTIWGNKIHPQEYSGTLPFRQNPQVRYFEPSSKCLPVDDPVVAGL